MAPALWADEAPNQAALILWQNGNQKIVREGATDLVSLTDERRVSLVHDVNYDACQSRDVSAFLDVSLKGKGLGPIAAQPGHASVASIQEQSPYNDTPTPAARAETEPHANDHTPPVIVIECHTTLTKGYFLFTIPTLAFAGRIDGADLTVRKPAKTNDLLFGAAEGGDLPFAFCRDGDIRSSLLPHMIYRLHGGHLDIDDTEMKNDFKTVVDRFCRAILTLSPSACQPPAVLVEGCKNKRPVAAFSELIHDNPSEDIKERSNLEFEGLIMQLIYAGDEQEAWKMFDAIWPDVIRGKVRFRQAVLDELACYPHLEEVKKLNPQSTLIPALQCKTAE